MESFGHAAGWFMWGTAAGAAAFLSVRTIMRLLTDQPLGLAIPWQAVLLTLLSVLFIAFNEWNKLHLLWLMPIAVVVPIARIFR